jgi:hypothetical protein
MAPGPAAAAAQRPERPARVVSRRAAVAEAATPARPGRAREPAAGRWAAAAATAWLERRDGRNRRRRGGRRGGTTGTAGAGGATICPAGGCPPLMIGDLQALDDSGAPGFDAAMFRCMALTICQNSSSCVYFANRHAGQRAIADDVYNDGAELTPAAVKLSISTGAQSQCVNPSVTLKETDFITLTFDGGKRANVYLPSFMGNSLTLYIASDGSTFTDAALTMPARLRP